MKSIASHHDPNLLHTSIDFHSFDEALHQVALEELAARHVLDYSRDRFPPRGAQGELWSISPKLPSLSICVDLIERCMCYTTSTGAWTCDPIRDRITAGISDDEAKLWWHYFTDPAHLSDAFNPIQALIELYPERSWRRQQDATQLLARFEAYVLACRAHATFEWCPRDMMWLASLMGHMLPPHQVLEVWLETENVPGDHERVLQWLERPDTPERAEALDEALLELVARPVYRSDQAAFRRALMSAATEPDLVKRFARFDRSCDPRASLIPLEPNDLEHFLLERDDPELWAYFFPRGFRQITPRAIIKFVELAGYARLPTLFSRLVKIGRPSMQRRVMSTLCCIHSVHAVRGMLDLYRQGHVGKQAKRWLLSEGANAIVGLCQLSTSRTYRVLCARFLRAYSSAPEYEALVKAHVQSMSGAARRWLEREVIERASCEQERVSDASCPWFEAVRVHDALKNKRPPTFASLDLLPALRCAGSGARLSRTISKKLLCLLSRAPSELALLELYRTHVCPVSLSRFVRAVFHEWLRHGAEVSGLWVLNALITVGGALGRFELLSTARDWSRGSKRGRVAKIVALFEENHTLDRDYLINAIQRHAPTLGVGEDIPMIIGEGSFSTPSVAIPEVLPTFGFEDEGYVFDLGGRVLDYVCGVTGELELRDRESRQVYATFPRRRKSDDPELYEWSRLDYSILSWHANLARQEVLTWLSQLSELSHAWPRASWELSFCANPLFRDLGKRLLWLVRGGEDAPRVARLCEDLSLSCVDDELIEIASVEYIALAHPVFISASELTTWYQRFSEYELIQPFEQLAKAAMKIEPLEEQQRGLVFEQYREVLDVSQGISYWRLADVFGGTYPVVEDGVARLQHDFDELRIGVTVELTPSPEHPNQEGVLRQLEFWRDAGTKDPVSLHELDPLLLHDLLTRLAHAHTAHRSFSSHDEAWLEENDLPF